jgi:hypothetical protein
MAKKSWVTSTRRTILVDHRDAYDAADDGPERTTVMKSIKKAIRDAGGVKIPKKLTKVRPTLQLCPSFHPQLSGN